MVIPATLVRPFDQNVLGRIGEARSAGYTPGQAAQSRPRPGRTTTFPTLLGPILVCSQQNYLKLLLTVR